MEPNHNWTRMRFKSNKVWVAVDNNGRPLLKETKALVKYQLDQPHEYRVNPSALKPLDSEVTSKSTQKSQAAVDTIATRPEEKISCEDAVCIYTDGACSGNPGPAGIGVILNYKGHQKEISRYIGTATNNVAELEAILTGLKAIKNRRHPVVVFTDSQYAFGLLTLGWKAGSNLKLVNEIRALVQKFENVRFVKIKGHAGHAENERADRLAVQAIEKAVGQ